MSAKKYFSLVGVITALFFGFLFLSNYSLDYYSLTVLANIYIFIILAISYNLINGVTGQFSLEPNGFVAIGAYVTALLILTPAEKVDAFTLAKPLELIATIHISNPFIVLIISGLISSLVALTLAFPVFRVRGDYLAIVTLGFGLIIRFILINNPQISNGSSGITGIDNFANYLIIGSITFLSVILVYNIVYSKFGRAMKAVRDDEDAALAMGINTMKIKTIAFMSSAFFEGVAGGLLASFIGAISPDQFTFMFTFQLLVIIVLGGLGSISGSIIATFLVMGGMEVLRVLDDRNFEFLGMHGVPGLRMVVFSVILILIMIFARKGLLGDKEIWELRK
jgi:branched-chain amino acid transport system permease protein